MNFDTNTKLNIILAILAIILVLAMILVFRKTGESYASCGEKSEPYADGYHKMPDGTIMKDSDHNDVTCPNARCNADMCAICKTYKNKPGKRGCAVCGL
jgi:hypothetical protein